MCGIWGRYHVRDHHPIDRSRFVEMGQGLRHRGPDETGSFIDGPIGLGIHRLRVIDLVSGQQPVANEDGSLVVVLNGEIYNHQELRADLLHRGHRFKGRSDTEVIVHAYEEEGPSCLARLDGIFAIALWDGRQRRLFLARDRLGVKPLYYAYDGARVLFGSELKALLNAPDLDLQMDPLALEDYFSLGYVPGPKTIFQGVHQLPAGHYALCDANGLALHRYWTLQFGTRITDSLEACEERVLALTREAVQRQMISDVPLGAFLSGGIDSSVVVALMAQACGRTIQTFSIRFAEASYDESPFARQVSRLYGTEHHEILCDPRACVSFLPKLPYYADGLFADPSLVPTYVVSQEARRAVTVVLSGDGGDEVFAGYPTYQADALLAWYRRVPRWLQPPLEAAVRALPVSSKKLNAAYIARKFLEGSRVPREQAHYWWRTVFSDEEKDRLVRREWRQQVNGYNAFESFQRQFQAVRDCAEPLDQYQTVDVNTWLVDDILVKVDRMSMAHALEARVPLLDQRLVEYAASIPTSWRMRGLRTKYLFKRVAARLLPAHIVHRKKSGFLPALSAWFHSEWRDLLGDTLSPSAVQRLGWVEGSYVQQLMEEHWQRKQDHGFKLWNLLMLCWWEEGMREIRQHGVHV